MLVSGSWLKKYVRIPADTNALVEAITMAGLNVEHVEKRGLSIDHLVIGKVLEKTKHPNADRLSWCRVAVGPDDVREIVCGAPNVAAGQFVAVALPGAELPNGLKIKRSKIRGVESDGMICSETELGIGEDSSGIIVLDGEYEVGSPAGSVLAESDDILEIEVTANRGDLLCHVGVAREIAAIYRTPLELPAARTRGEMLPGKADFAVDVEDGNDCPRYVGLRVGGVRVGQSPEWLAKRLQSVGVQSVNNVVDVTNFVMMELGQPLHAFDFRRLEGGVVKVRRAKQGERLSALDGRNYELNPGVLVIADKDRPVALAGIIGGEETSVHPETTELLIESANFHPTIVRRGRKALGISSEASYRFERGVDRELSLAASERAAELMSEICGGKAGAVIDRYASRPSERSVSVRESNARRILGTTLSTEEIAALLERLGFEVQTRTEEAVTVRVPSYRLDVEQEIDLIEEVGRLHGYDRIGTGWSFRCTTFAQADEFDRYIDGLSDYLAARGFTEIVGSAFTDGRELEEFGWGTDDPRSRPIAIRNPLSSNHRLLRTSLVPGMLDVVRRNVDYGAKRLKFYQIGPVFLAREGPTQLPDERTMLTIVLTQPEGTDFWTYSKSTLDLFDIKGELEAMLRCMKVDPAQGIGYDFDVASGRFTYATKSSVLVEGGVLSESAAEGRGIEQPVWFASIDLAESYELRSRLGKLKPLAEYPASRRDLSLVSAGETEYREIEKALVKHAGPLLESISVFDVYRGENLAKGRTAYGVRLSFRAPDRTLRDEEVDKFIEKAVTKLKDELGVELRA
jgi:phenylalanyl-tRNA synthetase beta chain